MIVLNENGYVGMPLNCSCFNPYISASSGFELAALVIKTRHQAQNSERNNVLKQEQLSLPSHFLLEQIFFIAYFFCNINPTAETPKNIL